MLSRHIAVVTAVLHLSSVGGEHLITIWSPPFFVLLQLFQIDSFLYETFTKWSVLPKVNAGENLNRHLKGLFMFQRGVPIV
jgi:hypothetical protein